MSGINGLWYPDGRPGAADELAIMQRLTAHRGPDGGGVWTGRGIAFGQQLLASATEDTAAAARPAVHPCGAVLVGDLRLDNRRELAALALPADHAGDATDARLALAAYVHWGERFVEHLLGDFAIAVWDPRTTKIVLARDPLGVRPIYWSLRSGMLAFSSEIRALRSLSWVDDRIDEARLADHLVDREDDREATFHSGIRRLPPATLLRWRSHREALEKRVYWRPEVDHELAARSDAAYAEGFRERLELAVARRLRASTPVAVSLSGGLDSGSIACVGQSLLDRRGDALQLFSQRYDGCPGGDERHYVSAVSRQLGLDPIWVSSEGLSPLTGIDRMTARLEAPLNNPMATFGLRFWEAVRGAGCRVVVDGFDGDIAVSYNFYYLSELLRAGQIRAACSEAVGISRHYFDELVSPWSVLWRRGLRPLLPRLDRWWRPFRSTHDGLGLGSSLVRRGFARRSGLRERLRASDRAAAALRTARDRHCADIVHGLVAYAFEGTNKLCAASGLEPRHPFFDRELIEYCVALPRVQRMAGGVTRGVVRRAMAGVLPDSVRTRTDKFDPTAFFVDSLNRWDRPRLMAARDDTLRAVSPFVDAVRARRVFDRFCARPTADDAFTVWRLHALARWLESKDVRAGIDVGTGSVEPESWAA